VTIDGAPLVTGTAPRSDVAGAAIHWPTLRRASTSETQMLDITTGDGTTGRASSERTTSDLEITGA
jgi:hypothetical protein